MADGTPEIWYPAHHRAVDGAAPLERYGPGGDFVKDRGPREPVAREGRYYGTSIVAVIFILLSLLLSIPRIVAHAQ